MLKQHDADFYRDATPTDTYRPFTDESEDASGDGIVYADESEYIGDKED